jgi:hypothetical protein
MGPRQEEARELKEIGEMREVREVRILSMVSSDAPGYLETVVAKPTHNPGQSRSGAASRQMRNGSGATRFGI